MDLDLTDQGKFYDASELYDDINDSWTDIWDEHETLFSNVMHILRKLILIEEPDKQLTIAAIYMLSSSKLSTHVPILLCYGPRGSGKTTISVFAAQMHGQCYTFSPGDTFASIRNALTNMTYHDPVSKTFEREGILLPWDNLHLSTFVREPKIYQTLLTGYDRKTARITIADSEGGLIPFMTYGQKIISTVDNFYNAKYPELQRRLLPLYFKPMEDLIKEGKVTPEYMQWFEQNQIDLSSFSWSGIQEKYYNFWENRATAEKYVKHKKKLNSKSIKGRKPDTFTSEKWIVSVDLMASALTLEVFDNAMEAMNFFSKHWEWIEAARQNTFGNFKSLLSEYIADTTKIAVEQNKIAANSGLVVEPVSIDAKRLKAQIMTWGNQGLLEKNFSQTEIVELMLDLGWKLSPKGWQRT